MKVLFINAVCGTGSTGRICAELAEQYEKKGWECKIAYGRYSYVPDKYKKYAMRIGTDWDVRCHAIRTRLLDEHGFGSKKATKKFLDWVEEYKPDLLWLHNLHGYYINIEMLFNWIKAHPELRVKWTLHDCWAFTGHCAHFMLVNCEKWKVHCCNCVQKNVYPSSKVKDNSFENYERKRHAFTGVKNMTIITPCKWLANLVKQSFLNEYDIEVVYNTIDKNIFKPVDSGFRTKYKIENKKIVLGVASTWDKRKGLEDLIKLAKMLDDRYVIVIVGLNDKQISSLSKINNIIGIKKTNNIKELAAIYSAADVFVNPTHEDNYPTVNLEAQACGTFVITYDTGGCRETIISKGETIPADIDVLYQKILEWI